VRNERDATKEAARGTRLLGRLWNGTGNERLAEPEGRVLDVPGICVLMQVRWLCSRPKESVSQSVSRSRRVALGCATRLRGRFAFSLISSFPSFFSFLFCAVFQLVTLERGLAFSRCSPTGIIVLNVPRRMRSLRSSPKR